MNANLFDNLTQNPETELTDLLLAQPGIRIERIVSNGQSSPPGFWYDQEWAEWVVVLCGNARLRFKDDPEPREMKPGDHVYIAAGRRHRVDSTDGSAPTLWLAVHFDESRAT